MAVTRPRISVPVTVRLCGVLVIGAVIFSAVVAAIGAGRERQQRVAERRARALELCESLARRAAPLLERKDDLRLAVLAASAADLGGARVVLLDATGRVRIDTGLGLGGRVLGIETSDRSAVRAGDAPAEWEVLAPALGNDGFAGEVRLRYRDHEERVLRFPWSLFALTFLCAASLITLACWMTQTWLQRVRRAVVTARRLARGSDSEARHCEVGDLQEAMERLSIVTESNTRAAEEGCLRLAREVVHALEVRGHVVHGHGERTSRWAALLAAELGADDATLRDVTEAARVLDLGKAGVRPSALTKAGGLDAVELDSLRQHPARGGALLGVLPGLVGIAEAVRHQHERWDGGGFPEGLRGARIPWSSRVLTIASAYDLLTTAGPALSWPEALDRMREDRGEMFDPEIFDAFERLVRREAPARAERCIAMQAGGAVAVTPYKLGFDETLPEWEVSLGEVEEEIFSGTETEVELLVDDGFEQEGECAGR